MAEQDATKWKTVRTITAAARKALTASYDESIWNNRVVCPLLDAPVRREEEDLLSVYPIPSVSVAHSLIPTYHGEPVAFRKIDLAFLFSVEDSPFGWPYQVTKKKNDGVPLSQAEDSSFQRHPQFAGVEVKSPDGSYYEPSVRLAIWLAAGLEKTKQLMNLARNDDPHAEQETLPLPYVGIAVVGHVWNLHVAFKATTGTVTIYGPLVIGDTMTTRGTFRVMAALGYLRTWAEETYHPWLLDNILLPLAGLTRDGLRGPSGAGPAQDDDGNEEEEEEEEREYKFMEIGSKRKRTDKGKGKERA